MTSPHITRIRPRWTTEYVSQGRSVLTTGLDGQISSGTNQGLFVHETRLLSRYRYLIDEQAPEPVVLSNVEQHSWLGYYILLPPGFKPGPPGVDQGSGQVPDAAQHTLELRVSRVVGEGLHEDLDLTNFSQQVTRFVLAIDLDADFADLTEATGERPIRGDIQRTWLADAAPGPTLRFRYLVEHEYTHQEGRGTTKLDRALSVVVEDAGSPPHHADGRLTFAIDLPPGGRWHACVKLLPEIDGERLPAPESCRAFSGVESPFEGLRTAFLRESTSFETPASTNLKLGPTGASRTISADVCRALDQAKHDLIALRLYDLDHGADAWVPAAGLPLYIALFGRDTLTTAFQAALLGPEMMRGSLLELARWQGREVNDWRDEEPGRMLHEAHTGPLEVLNINPRQRSYSSVTTSAFYAVVVSELWHWTGDRELVAKVVEPALRALDWLRRYGDLDEDGFYEYRSRSTHPVRHQAWKDSGDAIVYEDGSQVDPPIATCEEQAFAYIATLHLSEVLWWLDRKDEARTLFHQASELKKRFNEAFWIEDQQFVAMGLDSSKRQIRSAGSNPGHCLAAGIIESDRAGVLGDRLLAPDLFSGWGVRTLSATHPAYNPYSYHRGSVWPVEQGTFALGFARYGLHDQLDRLCRAQFEAAALFEGYRLPEVFSGHPRDPEHPFPALYPRANSPQAWSASAVFCMLQALLGLYPYAPLKILMVDPHLPEWLPEITLRGLRVGQARLTIRFWRKASGESDYQIEEEEGSVHVIRQPSPWSLTAGFGERVVDLLTSLLPGR